MLAALTRLGRFAARWAAGTRGARDPGRVLWRCLRCGHRDERLQRQEALLPDTAYVHQVLDLLERATLLAILEDPFGGCLSDAGQRLELRDRCGIQVDR